MEEHQALIMAHRDGHPHVIANWVERISVQVRSPVDS